MTCKHGPYDPSCSSYQAKLDRLKRDYEKHIAGSITPDATQFVIEEVEEVGRFLVVKARYPNCKACSYEGTKIMVFEASLKDAVKWKEIDPHFRQPGSSATQAPSPIARFPGHKNGWKDALDYASKKKGP